MFSLDSKVAFVTGGNGGIGLGIAKGFIEQGASVVLAARTVSKLESAIADTKKALEGDDKETIEKARDELMAASHKLAEILYQQSAETGAAPDGNGTSGPADGAGPADAEGAGPPDVEGEVVDAEFEDTDKK